MTDKLSARWAGLTGWRGTLLDFSLGALAALSLNPAGIIPASLCFCFLFWRISTATNLWQAGWRSWMGATGWFTCSLYWISHSLFIGEAAFLFMLPFSVFGLPLFLALFWAAAASLSYRIGRQAEQRLIALAALLAVAELARGTLFTGFPWNAPGQMVLAAGFLAQSYGFVGQYGVNLAVFAGLTGLVFIWRRQIMLAGLSAAPLLILMGLSALHWTNIPSIEAVQDGRPLARLVQPNIDQDEKWKAAARPEHLQILQNLSRAEFPVPQFMIWPETAIAGQLPYETDLAQQMARRTAAFDGVLLTGILQLDEANRLYNVASMLDGRGAFLGIRAKSHLVPFGEYVPARQIPFIDAIAGPIDFSAGQSNQIFYLDGLGPVQVLICHEIIFPGFISDWQRPSVIVNITNDSWFGQTAGPYQHLEQARARAIEEGLPVLRVSNNGISAAIDPYGRILGQIPLGHRGALDVPVAAALAPTFYAENRWLGLIAGLVWLGLLAFFVDLRRQNRQNS